MTFKYALTVPAQGSHKLKRFSQWAAQAVPHVRYHLPQQAPIKTETLTLRVTSDADRMSILDLFPATLP